MMYLGVFLLIGLAAANHAWAPGKVFIYKHKHEVKLGYPAVAAPLAPAALECDIKLHAATADKFHVQMDALSVSGTDYAKFLQQPFHAHMKAGMVNYLHVAPTLPSWAVNILKAKMSVFNLNLMGLHLHGAEGLDAVDVANAKKKFFTVWEETHFGLCKASYAISPLPAHLAECKEECMAVPAEIKAAVHEHLLVTKIVDVHKCKAASILAHVMPPVANLKPYAPAVNALYTKVVTSQYILHGDRANFLVKAIKHVEKVALNPLKGETAKVLLETVSSWKLASMAPAVAPAPALPFAPKMVKSVMSDIVPWAAAALDDVAMSPFKKALPIHKAPAAVVEKVVALLADIVADVDAAYADPAAKVVSAKFLAVEEAAHFMDLADIIAVHEKAAAMFAGDKFHTAKSMLLDACAMAGTAPCVAFLKKMIIEGKVCKEHAAVFIMTLPMTMKTPTAAVIKELHALVHHLESFDHHLYTTALMSFSNIVYHHCVKPAHMAAAGSPFASSASALVFCDAKTPEVVAFIEHLDSKLKMTTKLAIKVAAIKALANTAHPLALQKLKPFVLAAGDDFLRIQAISSLHRAAACHKTAVVDMLMGVFVNLKEAHEVRIAAAAVVLTAAPCHHVMAKLAVTTWYEPSVHAHTFIHTALKCLSVAKLPVDPIINHAAKAALALCKPYPALFPFSFHGVYADYMKGFNVGAAAGASVIGSAKSLVPTFVHQFFVAMEGYPTKRFESSFAAVGIEDAIMAAVGKHNVDKVMDVVASIHPKLRSAWKETMAKWMVQDKYTAAAPVKAAAWFRIHDAMETAFVLDGTDTLMEKFVAFAIQAVAALQDGVAINVQKVLPLVDTMVIVPTEVGYPAQVRIVVPVALSLKGSVKATMGAKPSFEFALQPLISAAYHAKATVFGFPTEKFVEAGIFAHAQAAVPACKFVAVLDTVAKAAQFRVIPSAAAAKAKIFHFHAAPYVAHEAFANIICQVEAFPSFKPIMVAAPVKEVIAAEALKDFAGVHAWIEHETHSPLATLHHIKAFVLKHYKSPLALALHPHYVVQHLIHAKKLAVAVDFAASPSKEFKFEFKYFATVAKEVADSWAAGKHAAAKHESGIWESMKENMFMADEVAAAADATAMCVQAEKPLGSVLAGAKVHNLKMVATCVGAKALVYDHLFSAAITPDFKLLHFKHVFAAAALPGISAVPYKVIVEATVANHISHMHLNSHALYGKAAMAAPEKLHIKAKVFKSAWVIADEAKSDIKFFDSVSMTMAHSSGMMPDLFHQAIKRCEHILTFAFYPYMSAEFPAKAAAGMFAVDLVINPKYKVCDIVLKKPAEIIAFKGIHVPHWFHHILPVPVNMKGFFHLMDKIDMVSGGLLKSSCHVDAAKVVTFDGVKVPVAALAVGKEVLLAKYSGSADTAVVSMVKKAAGMAVKVVKASKVIMVESSAAGVAVAVDGAAVAVADVHPVMAGDKVVAKIVKVAHGVEVVSPIYAVSKAVVADFVNAVSKVVDISNMFDAADVAVADKVVVTKDAVAVKITPISRGKMVGVCGNYNGEKFDDMDIAIEKKVAKAEEYEHYYHAAAAPAEHMDDHMYMDAVSKKIEKLFAKFTME